MSKTSDQPARPRNGAMSQLNLDNSVMGEEAFMNCLSEIKDLQKFERSDLTTFDDNLLYPRSSAWYNIFSVTVGRMENIPG